MAWTKPQPARTAKAGADDITFSLRRDVPSGDWLATVSVETEDGGAETSSMLLGAAVTEGTISDDQRTRPLNIARALRNRGLALLGYVQT